MKLVLRLLMLAFAVSFLVSCSGSKTAKNSNDAEVIELSDGEDEILEINTADGGGGIIIDDSVGTELPEVQLDNNVIVSNDAIIQGDDGIVIAEGAEMIPTVNEPVIAGVETPGYEISNSTITTTNTTNANGVPVLIDPSVAMASADKEVEVYDGAMNIVETQDRPSYAATPVTDYSHVNMPPPASVRGGEIKTYTVGANETLMLAAFKIYGDYRMWRELARLNQDVLKGSTSIGEGMVLRYEEDGKSFSWNPDGEPYLIKMGDTLSLISNKVYGRYDRWRGIWNNNRPLIRDPNIIFAGFTIYYLLDEGREVASQ